MSFQQAEHLDMLDMDFLDISNAITRPHRIRHRAFECAAAFFAGLVLAATVWALAV